MTTTINKNINILRYSIFIILTFFCASAFAKGDKKTHFQFYGFIRNDFYYNSRQNEQSVDGVFNTHPKPIEMKDGKDVNATPQAQLISVCTRLGVDVTGINMLGAASSAKVEADFAGFGSNFYVLRIRQAYAKLQWENAEILLGQTWHPMSSIMPSVISLNTGAPFQPFNRSPQLRYTQKLGKQLYITAGAIYQMQYTSYGPGSPAAASYLNSASASYLKNAILPNFFIGLEQKNANWTNGVGFDIKTIKPDIAKITSTSASVYSQYSNNKLQAKAKVVWGQNVSDHTMLSGYGASKIGTDGKATEYTNFNIISSWVNVVYGTTWKVGIFGGISKNFGTDKNLVLNNDQDFLVYGRGLYNFDSQILLDCLYRVSPYVSYNLSKLSIGVEYNFTSASYGELLNNGKVTNPYTVNNHRILASVIYTF